VLRPQVVKNKQQRPTALQHLLESVPELLAVERLQLSSRTAADLLGELSNELSLPVARKSASECHPGT
jgi:hypothetical protein